MLNEWMHLAVNFSLTLSACVLAVAVLRPAVRWLGGPRAQYALWLAVPLCLLAWRLPAPPVALPLAPVAVHKPIAEWRSQATEFLREPAPPPAANGMPQRAAPRSGLQQLLFGAWLLGGAGLCLLLWRQHRRWSRQLVWQPDAARWRLPVGHSPAVVGWWKPKLALPDDFAERFTAEEQALILTHEAVHARRRDSLWNAFVTALCVLQWFNPLAWWALRRFQRDQELACDAAALAALPATQRRPYWDALLKAHALSPSSALARGWRSAHPLIERLRWVQHGVQGRSWAALGLVPMLVLAMSGAVYATHGAAVWDPGLKVPNIGELPEARIEIRTQVNGERWTHDAYEQALSFAPNYATGLHRAQRAMSIHYSPEGPLYALTSNVLRNDKDEVIGIFNLREPPPARREPPGPIIASVQTSHSQGWQRMSARTAAGLHVRVELRVTRLPRPASGS
ncbi:MAG: hypothetical protein J0L58_08490 [Burkholderiales bacterium]|nr:hypothetical protein [Burkholderiales bacterium]